MGVCTVYGGTPLFGSVKISGSKNAALPILFATMLCRGVSVIENCPDISDVSHTLSILSSYGAKVMQKDGSLMIDTVKLCECEPADSDVRAFRASSYLIGACLARFGRVKIRPYGGCAFSDRPIDMHIGAALSKGCLQDKDMLYRTERSGHVIRLEKNSVGATVNAILLSATDGCDTVIEGAAKEPHIDGLIAFLNSAGADIRREDRTLTVRGTGGLLTGGRSRIIPDAIEAGSYLALGPLTGGRVGVLLSEEYRKSELMPFLDFLQTIGVSVKETKETVSAEGTPTRQGRVIAEPYPGFPTDLQPIASVLLSVCGGEITDTVFPERFGYLSELEKFGIRSASVGTGRAGVFPSCFHPGEAVATDLRGGMAALSAALSVKGRSRLRGAEFLLRGYADLFCHLTALGAKVDFRF